MTASSATAQSPLYLLDTNIVSHMMKDGLGRAAQRGYALAQTQPQARIVTSIIVQCELLFGLRKYPSARMQQAYAAQMARLLVLPFDTAAAEAYASLRATLERQGTPMGANDLLIAAQALAIGATVVSADAAFARVPGLQVSNWLA